MIDSPTGISQLSQLLDGKIQEVAELRRLLTSELQRMQHNNIVRQELVDRLAGIDCQQLSHTLKAQLSNLQSDVLAAIRTIHEKHSEQSERMRQNYQREIFELETELQKQYRLTRSMKGEVEELKGLVESFMKEKRQKEEPKQIEVKCLSITAMPLPPMPPMPPQNHKAPTLEIITEQDQSQSTKREPEELDSPHLERPRITIKEYITLECLQNKMKSSQDVSPQRTASPRFSSESREVIRSKDIPEPQASPLACIKQVHHNSSVHSSNKKPARFFLEEFKKSFEKTLSENSIDRKDCITASSNMDPQDLFSLEDSSKKFDSSGSTPTSTQMLGKVTFGKEKKFFSQLEESEGEGPSDELIRDIGSYFKPAFNSRQRSTTANRSKEREQALCQRVDDQSMKNPSYLLAHVKKKLNYNSMSNSSSNNQLKDKQRESSYSSRDKIGSNRQDRYKMLIKNILNLKEKENHNHSAMLSRDKKKGVPIASNASTCLITPPLFVGDHKSQTKYEGAKRDGKRHGRGVLHFSNGLTYEGEFREGLRCGYGILKFNNIEIYNGDWDRDMLNGQGRIKNCTVITRKKKEPATTSGPQLHRWISYSGQFRDNRFHGTGTLFLQSGEKFLGKFCQGLAEGEGTFYKTNGEVEFGVCHNNFFSQKF